MYYKFLDVYCPQDFTDQEIAIFREKIVTEPMAVQQELDTKLSDIQADVKRILSEFSAVLLEDRYQQFKMEVPSSSFAYSIVIFPFQDLYKALQILASQPSILPSRAWEAIEQAQRSLQRDFKRQEDEMRQWVPSEAFGGLIKKIDLSQQFSLIFSAFLTSLRQLTVIIQEYTERNEQVRVIAKTHEGRFKACYVSSCHQALVSAVKTLISDQADRPLKAFRDEFLSTIERSGKEDFNKQSLLTEFTCLVSSYVTLRDKVQTEPLKSLKAVVTCHMNNLAVLKQCVSHDFEKWKKLLIAAPSLKKTSSFIAINDTLDEYLTQLAARSGDYGRFDFFKMGFSKHQKTEAVAALKKYLDNPQDCPKPTDDQIKVLKNGRLRGCLTMALRNMNNPHITTIDQLLDQVSREAAPGIAATTSREFT